MQPVIRTLAAVLLTGVLSMPAMPIEAQTNAPAAMPLAFADLEGWSGERHDEALEVLLRSCARAGIGRAGGDRRHLQDSVLGGCAADGNESADVRGGRG